MGKRLSKYNNLLWLSLVLGFLSGCVGVLVDLDHWFNTQSYTIPTPLQGRPLHIPMAIFACCLGIYCCTRLGRLVNKQVLKNILICIGILTALIGLELLWARFMGDI